MQRIIERVQKLIALANSSNDNEARNAAMVACRLIREHHLHLTSTTNGRPASRDVVSEVWSARSRQTQAPYRWARDEHVGTWCRECSEPISPGDVFRDVAGHPVHGDCIPKGERP